MALGKATRVGRLRGRINLQQRSTSEDAQGGRAFAWTTVSTDAADIRQKTYSKSLEGLQEAYNAAYDIFIRYNSKYLDWKTKQIVYKGNVLKIYSVIDLDERGKYLKILAYGKL